MYGYTPMYSTPSPSVDERIWVQNEVSADAYLVAPNGFVRLWDANKPRYYEKRADATGRPYPIDVYEYSKIAPISPVNAEGGANYQSKDIEGLMRRIEALEEALNGTESNANDTGIQ